MELIEGLVELILAAAEIALDIREDLRNRNDRGLFKRSSNKYVC